MKRRNVCLSDVEIWKNSTDKPRFLAKRNCFEFLKPFLEEGMENVKSDDVMSIG